MANQEKTDRNLLPQKVVDHMIEFLMDRGGFEGWWGDLDADTAQELKHSLALELFEDFPALGTGHHDVPLRDYFAAAALTGFCNMQGGRLPVDRSPEITADCAYNMADAMLDARDTDTPS